MSSEDQMLFLIEHIIVNEEFFGFLLTLGFYIGNLVPCLKVFAAGFPLLLDPECHWDPCCSQNGLKLEGSSGVHIVLSSLRC